LLKSPFALKPGRASKNTGRFCIFQMFINLT
jgi:hypothetical protein